MANKIDNLRKIVAYYLVALVIFSLGIGVVEYDYSPYHQVKKEIQEYIKGHELGKETTIVQKIQNDIGIKPSRYLRKYPNEAIKDAQYLKINGLAERRESPLMFIDPKHAEGYRAIFGAFDFKETFWGGILLGPDGSVLHDWKLSTDHLPTNEAPTQNKNLYGLHLFPDGSVIFLQQEAGGGIVKVDACNNIAWDLPGDFHHTISSPTIDGAFWAYMGKQTDFDHKLAKISIESGEIIKIIDMGEVRKKNPFVHIFNLHHSPKERDDISHGNDIEPLSDVLSSKFEMFDTGDLLLSYRTQNLVFVLDPDTLKVKWWRIGEWGKQHDTDWEEDGSITVFSNNAHTVRHFSDIISIDPASYESKVLVDGENYSFFSDINGRHEITPFNTRMITSTTQGWAFEVDNAGKVVFSFINNYAKKERASLNISESIRVEKSYFKEEFWEKCTN